MRILLISILIFATTELYAQGFIQQVTPGPVQQVIPRQVVPQQLVPQQLPAQALSPQQMVPKQLQPEQVAKEGEKLLGKGVEAVQAGTSGLPGPGGGPVKIDCPLDKLVDAAKSLEDLAKNHANDVKNFNDQMAATAKNVGEAQLSIIKKTVEEAGKLLLNPFQPLIDIVKNYKKYYDDLIEAVKTLAWKFVLVIGGVLGFMIGLPFWILIRAITPGRKHA
jgi:hypothetical protein